MAHGVADEAREPMSREPSGRERRPVRLDLRGPSTTTEAAFAAPVRLAERMHLTPIMIKKIASTLLLAGLLTLGAATANAQSSQTAPKSVIHVVTVDFKPGTTDAQIKAATDGVHKLPSMYKGITRVWTRVIKNQSGKKHIFVMEFADEKALADYADSPAQTEWYKVYLDIRQESATSDITN